MLRAVLALVLVLLCALSPVEATAAGETWCADDPVVSIDGRLLDIQVQMPIEHLLTMRTTTLTVVIPRNLSGTVVVDDVSAFPMRTTVVSEGAPWDGSTSIDVRVVVDVAAGVDYPIRVVMTPLGATATPVAAPTIGTGTANSRLVVPMVLGR